MRRMLTVVLMALSVLLILVVYGIAPALPVGANPGTTVTATMVDAIVGGGPLGRRFRQHL